MIRSAGERIAGIKELRARMETVLRDRERQLIERRGRCTATECGNVATQAEPVAEAPPPETAVPSVVREPEPAKQDEPQPLASAPKEKPVFVPPEFPQVTMRDCEDCYELWDEILFYESLIGNDSRWLFDNRTEVQNRKDEIVDLQSKLPKAGSADKVFYSREIDRHTVRIAETEALNRDLEELIRKEWAILKDRIAQYADCVERHCPVPVAAARPSRRPRRWPGRHPLLHPIRRKRPAAIPAGRQRPVSVFRRFRKAWITPSPHQALSAGGRSV